MALLAALVAIENGLQVAFMAPTGVLAEQHARTLRGLLAATPWEVDLLTGSTPGAARREILGRLANGSLRLVVGTHALVEDPVGFAALGLVVIDEQHRFGVLQRATLRQKGWCPDVLVMTATPIPRTLALTVYGDLDVSVIHDRPPGRVAIKTTVRPDERRDAVYAFVREQVDAGRQAYVVYPLVDESDKVDVRSATAMATELAAEPLSGMRLGLVHGRMRADEKDDVMRAFASGDLDVLVSTTVVEVGVDVPNATVMVVEHAERFGLAQLHQLRGRVGRGAHQSFCVLLYQSPLTDEARARLKVISETDDGFVIAERDLDLRGPGDVFGTRQSGMPRLRIGDMTRDRAVMEAARTLADEYVAQAAPGDGADRRDAGDMGRALRPGGDRMTPSSLRVIAGAFKGRRLATPSWEGLRPSSDRLRETLFNVVAARVAGSRWVDACAGTGAVGIEALSRGAAHVTFIEHDGRAVDLIQRNLRHCGIEGGYTMSARTVIVAAARLAAASVDVAFLDPPYDADDLEPMVEALVDRVAPGGLIVVEHARRRVLPGQCGRAQLVRTLASGDSALSFYTVPGG